MESILTSIKKLLGPEEEYDHFDTDIILHINSVFMVLTQIGVGPAEGFSIKDKTATWSDFLPDGTEARLEAVKTYVYLRVKILFDPPTSSFVMESYKQQINELEWRLNIAAESDPLSGSGGKLDYNDLDNLPSINGETLKGNYNEKDPTVKTMPSSDVDSIWKDVFGN